MRVLATGGIIGIDVILGAVLVDQSVAGWIDGLAVGAHLGDPGCGSVVVAPALRGPRTGDGTRRAPR